MLHQNDTNNSFSDSMTDGSVAVLDEPGETAFSPLMELDEVLGEICTLREAIREQGSPCVSTPEWIILNRCGAD